MIEITSSSNEHFKRWSELNQSRGLRKHQEFFLMGEKLINEFLKNPTHKIKAEIICEGLTGKVAAAPKASPFGKVPVFKLSQKLFNEIDFIGTHHNLLVLALPESKAFDAQQKAQGLEVITPLGDPSNLGALARSALAFGAKKLILTQESASPYLPKAIKASAGAVLQLPLFFAPKLEEVCATTPELFALDMRGQALPQVDWPQNVRLLIGEEGPGLGQLKIKNRIYIPTGPIESLNATVAASIALYSYAQKFNTK